MKKLFTGRVGRIPIALLVGVLLAIPAAGGVVAAVTGHILWQGSSNVTVSEPVHIYYGASNTTCNTALTINTTMSNLVLWPGECDTTWFKFSSESSANLLLKSVTGISGGGSMTVTFYDAVGNPSTLSSTGLLIKKSDGDVLVRRAICVDGASAPSWYTIGAMFTRESPPAP